MAAENAAALSEHRREAQENYLLGEVRNYLSRYLVYPSRAKKRGWEGEVLVGFKVDAEGRLASVHLTRSSGYSLLDDSALAAMNKIETIPLVETRRFLPMELELPVLYQLREG